MFLDLLVYGATLLEDEKIHNRSLKMFFRAVEDSKPHVASSYLQRFWAFSPWHAKTLAHSICVLLINALDRRGADRHEEWFTAPIFLLGEICSSVPDALNDDRTQYAALLCAGKLWKQSLCMHTQARFLDPIMPR